MMAEKASPTVRVTLLKHKTSGLRYAARWEWVRGQEKISELYGPLSDLQYNLVLLDPHEWSGVPGASSLWVEQHITSFDVETL